MQTSVCAGSKTSETAEVGVYKSSFQQFYVLDKLIETAWYYVVNTRTTNQFLSNLIVYQLKHKRRRISRIHSQQESISRLATAISQPADLKLKTILEYEMDRGYSELGVEYILSLLKGISVDATARDTRIAFRAGIDVDKAWEVYSALQVLHEDIVNQKMHILMQYYEYMRSKAYKFADTSILPTPKEDLSQSMWLAGIKAVNHYRIFCGSFKAYLDTWIHNYMNRPSTHYGTAAYSPVINLYMPLEVIADLGYEMEGGEADRIIVLANLVDPTGELANTLSGKANYILN